MKPLVCITGAAGGLGKAFAVECASRGWELFITDLSEAALSALAAGLSAAYGIRVQYKTCDLTDIGSRTELFQHMQAAGLRFNMLINIAGLDYEGPFSERTREQIRTILRLNVEANLEMTYAVLKLREKEQPFHIINVASLAAYYPMPVKALYAASKSFLLDFSLALREELRPLGGTVTALCPGGMPTNELVIRCIDAQGLMGRLTTTNVGKVAACTVDRALRGRAVYIPGGVNRVLRFLGGLVPATVTARFIGSRWDQAHRKSHDTDGRAQGLLCPADGGKRSAY